MSEDGRGPNSVDKRKPLALGIVGGLVGIYLTPINPIIGPVLAALGAVCAIIWGADAIARVASYGLGTGVPSIGYMSLAFSLVGALSGLSAAVYLGTSYTWIGPILGFVLAMVVGAIVAGLGLTVLKMKIPILLRCTTELAGAAALSVLGFSAAIAGTYTMPNILHSVIVPGYIALFFILNTMAIQHPFNACLGPNENRTRTLKLAFSTAFISMAIVGVIAMPFSHAWYVIAIVGGIGWFLSISSFIRASKDEAALVQWTGWWPHEEGDDFDKEVIEIKEAK
jgi:tetrahydromethanopterin S-methyltransferase subunit C